MDVNPELLITLIKDRPALWDKTTEEYKDKRFTFEAWRDVCKNMRTNFDELPDEEKNEYGKLIMKKWSNMRDSAIKYHKKLNAYKSGLKGKKARKYLHYNQMQFLTRIIKHHPTQSSRHPSEVKESRTTTKNETLTEKESAKKEKQEELDELDELDKKLMQVLDATVNEDNSRSLHFFKGIAPTIDSYNDDDFLDFEIEVLKLIKNMKRKKPPPPLAYPYTQLNPGQHYAYRTAPPKTHSQLHGYQSVGPSGSVQSSIRDVDQIEIRRPKSELSANSGAVEIPSAGSTSSSLDGFDLDFAAPPN